MGRLMIATFIWGVCFGSIAMPAEDDLLRETASLLQSRADTGYLGQTTEFVDQISKQTGKTHPEVRQILKALLDSAGQVDIKTWLSSTDMDLPEDQLALAVKFLQGMIASVRKVVEKEGGYKGTPHTDLFRFQRSDPPECGGGYDA